MTHWKKDKQTGVRMSETIPLPDDAGLASLRAELILPIAYARLMGINTEPDRVKRLRSIYAGREIISNDDYKAFLVAENELQLLQEEGVL